MAILKDTDLFDFDKYRQQLTDTATAALELAQSTENSATRMKSAYSGTIGQIQQIQSGLASLSTAQVQQATQAVQAYDRQVDTLARDAEKYRALLKQMDDQQSASSFSLKEMATLLNGLEREYKSLKPDQADFALRQKEIGDKVRAVSVVLNAQNQVLREAKRATDAAEGSYTHLAQQTNELRQALRNLPDAFDKITGEINQHNRAAVEMQHIIERNDRVLRGADAQMGQHQRNVGNYSGALRGMGTDALFAVGGLIGVSSGLEAIKLGLGVISDMERINASLKAVSKDTADFTQTQQFLIATADQLGLRYDVLARSYKGLKAATNGTALEGKQTEQMFLGLVRAGASLKLSNEEIEGALRAMEQMMSKGKVTAEELRGQLGERLPGAMKLMAEATGISEAKLNKMMEQGELLAVDVLPKLAKQLDKTYGASAQNNLDSMAGGWNRMTNEVHLFLAAMNEDGAISRATNNITGLFAETMRGLRVAVQSSDWKTFFGALAPGNLGPLGAQARQQVGIYARNEATVGQFRTMTPQQRDARIGITKDAIDRDEKRLNTEFKDHIVGGSLKPKLEQNLNENRQLLVQLRREDLKLRVKDRKDADQAEVNAQRAAATKKEADLAKAEKEGKKAEAARRKAETEADRRMNESLTNAKAGTDLKLSGLSADKQDGLINEAEFIEKRKQITLAGIAERQAILSRAGQKEGDDYKKLAKEKIDAETTYQRDSLKLKLADSKTATAGDLAGLGRDKAEGLISEAEFVDRKNEIIVDGLVDQKRILEDAGQQNSQLTKDIDAQLLEANREYYRERLKVQESAWKTELAATKSALDEVDQTLGEDYAAQLLALTDFYDKKERAVAVAVAGKKLTGDEGEAQLHQIKLDRLRAELTLTEQTYAKDRTLSNLLVADKIAALETYKAESIRTPAEIASAEKQILALKATADKEAADDKKNLDRGVADNAKKVSDETTQHEIDNAKKAVEQRQQLWQQGLQLADTIGQSISEISSSYAQRDIEVLDKQKERELNLTGDNADAKARIEEQYAKRKAEIQRKSAVQERAAALFSIAINTAQAVMSVLSTGGGAHYLDFGVSAGILSAFVTAAGIAQAAVVLAKPLPTFWTGTSSAPEGLAELAERGPELRQKRDGSYQYYDKPTVDYLGAGDRIYTADQTARLVASWQQQQAAEQALQELWLNNQSTDRLRQGRQTELKIAFSGGNNNSLTEQQAERAFGRALDQRPSRVTHIDRDGFHDYLEENHSRTEYLNKRDFMGK